MSQSLEFANPANPNALTALNRNIRKFRILQYDTGEGLLPMLVGVYQVDPTTGNPISPGQQAINPLFFLKLALASLSNVVPGVSGKTITLYWGKISWATPAGPVAQEVFFANDNSGSAASTLSADFGNNLTAGEGNSILADFRPNGISLGSGKGLYVSSTSTAPMDVYGSYTQQ